VKPPVASRLARAFWERAKPYLPALAASGALAFFAIRKILADAGRPAMPLDDSFIHLVYARRFAEGAPFTFSPGDGVTSGATSFLWPLMLAPFWALGLRGHATIAAAWLLGTLLHAAVAVETKRLVEPFAGKGPAVGAGLMCLAFGAFTWFAWSGMETIAFTWALVRFARLAADYAERPREERTPRLAAGVAIAAALCPLFRPEGAPFALIGAAGLALFPTANATSKEGGSSTDQSNDSRGSVALAAAKARAFAAIPLAGAALVPLLNLALLGHTRGATAIVKWAPGNPYYAGDRLASYLTNTAKMLWNELLSGGHHTAIFLPENTHLVLALGAAACVTLTLRTRRYARAALGVALALGTLTTVTFLTILWNRVRYIWPFATGWFFLVACLAAELEHLALRVRKDATYVGALVTGMAAGALAMKLPWTIDDLANSARAIDQQQVTLGERASKELPEGARIGVNDTGAIAYFSGRTTFDVCGLTTEGEAPHWVAGSGSRFEHYERLGAARLPTHFIVYPEWMAMPEVLGERLFSATVTNQSILGGGTKVAYEANWDALGRAERPTRAVRGELVDAVDVADLVSEKEHGYELIDAIGPQNVVASAVDDDGNDLVEGARFGRWDERFFVTLPADRALRLVVRAGAAERTTIGVSLDGARVATLELSGSAWEELEVELPTQTTAGRHPLALRVDEGGVRYAAMHHWIYADAPKTALR
jgi:hypothetical protein